MRDQGVTPLKQFIVIRKNSKLKLKNWWKFSYSLPDRGEGELTGVVGVEVKLLTGGSEYIYWNKNKKLY